MKKQQQQSPAKRWICYHQWNS